MELDPNLLLTAEHLRLESGLLKGKTDRGAVAFKRVPSQTYLVVDALQAKVLEEFAEPKSVPAALEGCIRGRICPPLREFYDLVVKAHRAGVLRSEEIEADGPPPSTRLPVRWFIALRPWFLLPLIVAGVAAVIGAGVLYVPIIPPNWLVILHGWAVVCAALSLGTLLAASALRGAGGEVPRLYFRTLSLTPHLAIDLREVCMVGRVGRVAVLGSTILPLALVTAAALWQRMPWSAVPLAALFLACRPAGRGVIGKILALARRRPVIDTDGPPLFEAWASLDEEVRLAWRRLDLRVMAMELSFGILWTLALGATAYRLWEVPLDGLWEKRMLWLSEWQTEGLAVIGGLSGILLLWVLGKIQYHVADRCFATCKRWAVGYRRWRASAAKIDPFQLETLVRRNPLLGRLDQPTQEALLECLQPLERGPWRKVIAFGAEPEFVGLVLSGRATMYQRLKNGRRSKFLQIMEGDLFGAHKILDTEHGDLEIRTNTPFIAATLSRGDFQRLVIAPLGLPTVARYVQNHLFLQRASALSAEWRPAAVARFAELATTASHPAGDKILVQGQEVGSLYMLYDGQARAVKDRKPIGKLKQGDFFGEISLLQTSGATADVESKEDTRCLLVNRIEFIRFMSRNHHVALQLERLCSQRLGRPIFPLNQQSFDVR